MLAEDDYGAIPKKKIAKMHMAQRKYTSSYHSSCLIVMMLRGGLKKTGKLVMRFMV